MRLRLGTRGSRLALAQAREVAALLQVQGHRAQVVPMVTSGDRGAPAAASAQGAKGLFVAEITDALLRDEVDLAVHSAKDLPSEDPHGVVIAAIPERSVPYDVLVTREPELAPGGRVGTSSLRRRSLMLRMRPGVEVVEVRGNVDTRLRKVDEGEVDGAILAAAGLARLGVTPRHAEPLPMDEMVPAPGQGSLAVQARVGSEAASVAAALDHPASQVAFEAERALVAALGGGCRLPLGAYAERRGDAVRLLAVVVRPDGSDLMWSQVEAADAQTAAAEAAGVLREAGAEAVLRDLRG